MNDLLEYCHKEILPYMTRKTPNEKHSVYRLKHIAEAEIGRYVSQEEMQEALLTFGYPISTFYPLREEFFKRKGGIHLV